MNTKFSLLFLFFILNMFVRAQDIKIISSDASSIIIEYIPSYSDTVTINSNGNSYLKIELPFANISNIDNKGDAQLLVRKLNIGVASEVGNTIQIVSEDYSYLNGKYVPVPRLEKDSIANTERYFESDNYYKSGYTDVVGFGEFGLVRNLRVQTINIFPVQFNASANTIKLLKRLVFRINYASANISQLQKITDSFFQSLVLNWSVAENWGANQTNLRKTSSSVLATGDWYKFDTPNEGIYKIDRAFLQNLGIDVNSVDPRTIRIYGNGGYSLPESIANSNNHGLIENAIIIVGEQDGKFDENDYILFYGRPPEFWEYSQSSRSIVRVKQPFSRKNYYWLTYGGATGKRMTEKTSLNTQNAYTQETTLAFKSYDKDSINIGKSGRDYLCDPLNSSMRNRTYINSLNGILPASTISYTFRVVNASDPTITYRVDENNSEISRSSVLGKGSYYFGTENKKSISVVNNLPDERSVLKFVLETGTAGAEMYIDYFEIKYQKYLKAFDDNLLFFSKDTTAVINYALSNFSNSSIQTFDVTDFSNVKIISNASISGGQFSFQASENQGQISRYLAITNSQYKTPANPVKVENSNLRGNNTGSEMIVITAKEFKTQVERYVQYRSSESPNKLSTSIYYVDDIMNEFAGGLMDPTAIRDFLKYAYENWQVKPLYVLLFGDGSYDYLNSEPKNNNFVPTFQTPNSLYELSSYPYDDFYSRIVGNDLKADLAIGRLCVSSTEEAENAVHKIINYETKLDKGEWRNRFTFIGDDGPAGAGQDDTSTHTKQSDDLAKATVPAYIDLNKIYSVAYPTAYVAAGRRKPDVNKAIINAINNGTLILNYIGHGAPLFWAHEYIFEISSAVPQMENKNYFVLTAATCDFGLYDKPTSQSGAEILFNLEDKGAIVAMTAARVVESYPNYVLNQFFYKNLFIVHNTGGTSDRIGMAYLLTKQERTGGNDEKFHLFGDPAIRLNLPQLKVSIDSLNGKPIDVTAQIKALSNVKINGSVRLDNGSINPINGEAIVSVFDSQREQYFQEMRYGVDFQGGLIYRGRVTVNNGKFETQFVVPKDISYENEKGKIVAYFFNDVTDGVGVTDNFTVGGTDTTVVNDKKGPEIEIYFDDENFKDAYLLNPSFTLIAKLNDQTGLNTTGTGIGHKLEGIINDDLTNTIDLSNYFVGDINSGGKSGVINYKFSSMEPGDYHIKLKAWDVFNNFSSADAYFTVVPADEGIVVRDVYNYPNPFSSNTTFTFNHNITGAVNTRIKIYTIAGRLIKEIEEREVLDRFVRIDWDGRDEDGNSIANGTYLYKLIVESVDGKFKENILGKLAVIR